MTAKLKIMLESMIAEVRRLSQQHPEFVYEKISGRCLYTSGNNLDPDSGCIIGQAIMAIVKRQSDAELVKAVQTWLTAIDKTGVCGFISMALDQIPVDSGHSPIIFVTKRMTQINKHLQWLRNVQISQDLSCSWSKSVEIADAISMAPETDESGNKRFELFNKEDPSDPNNTIPIV